MQPLAQLLARLKQMKELAVVVSVGGGDVFEVALVGFSNHPRQGCRRRR